MSNQDFDNGRQISGFKLNIKMTNFPINMSSASVNVNNVRCSCTYNFKGNQLTDQPINYKSVILLD